MNIKQTIFKSIADLRFAIFILLLIATLSIIGTVIEQDQSIETYKLNYPLTNKVFGFLSWDILLRFGFDHIYKTWWFIALILLFGISLFACTLLQQFPSLKVARRCQFFRTTQQFRRLNISTNLAIMEYFLKEVLREGFLGRLTQKRKFVPTYHYFSVIVEKLTFFYTYEHTYQTNM